MAPQATRFPEKPSEGDSMIFILELSELGWEAKATWKSRLLTPMPELSPSPLFSPPWSAPSPTPSPQQKTHANIHTHTHTRTHMCMHTLPTPRFVCRRASATQYPGTSFQFSLSCAGSCSVAFHGHKRGPVRTFPHDFPFVYLCPCLSTAPVHFREKHCGLFSL